MIYDSELSQKQIKNLKRRLVSWIWETSTRRTIQLALFCRIKIPKNLLDKYTASHGQD